MTNPKDPLTFTQDESGIWTADGDDRGDAEGGAVVLHRPRRGIVPHVEPPPGQKKAALTDRAVQTAKPGPRPWKLWDERGLYLIITPSGSKLWRLRYRIGSKAKDLALGAYPDIPLKRARELREETRRDVAAGTDPAEKRKTAKAQQLDTFEAAARKWLSKQTSWAEKYQAVVRARLEQHVFPWLGSRPMRSITPRDVLTVLERIEQRKTIETAHRTKQAISQVFRFGIKHAIVDSDPCRDLAGLLEKPITRHFPAITDPAEVGGLLRALYGYRGTAVVQAALKLAPHVFVRPGELRKAEWKEIDLEAGVWNIPGAKMKGRQPLLVPLSRQAVAILRELFPLTGHGRWVFTSGWGGDQAMSENAVLSALRRSGIAADEMVGHGFRAMARTILAEVLHVNPDYIELQLGHRVPDRLGAAYNRTRFLKERTAMMQTWSDYLDKLREGKTDAT